VRLESVRRQPGRRAPAALRCRAAAIREWTEQNFEVSGYVTGSGAPGEQARATGEKLCVVTVGGSGVGESLLRRVLDAVPAARRKVPGLRFLVVTGPRVDPAALPSQDGVEIHGYLPDLPRHLAACDLAVVQGGLTTCMELTAARRPFIYVPLRHHFEQNFHVRHRLERYGAGRCRTYEEVADREVLAAVIAGEIGREVRYREVETDGAFRAAGLLAGLLQLARSSAAAVWVRTATVCSSPRCTSSPCASRTLCRLIVMRDLPAATSSTCSSPW
jgi:predicted glycosyltransferase